MIPARTIERKRQGQVLSDAELRDFFLGYLDGEVQEHQMSAFLMAVCFQGLHPDELDQLVTVMLESGAVLDFGDAPSPFVDKHSTGGVGDKVSLALAPLAAALGLHVPMMAGRGLGHTGGTLDKLEAIPGFRTDLPLGRFRAVLDEVGCAITGQTPEIAPLDQRLYALRDVTGTVASIPLIAASIMSKKLAEGLDGLVLDVKVGEGAFIQEEARALELATTMVALGARRGLATRALLTAMDRPLGKAVGNALEVAEAVECLRGSGPPELREIVLVLAIEMALVGGLEIEAGAARERALAALDGGEALERFRRLVSAQGGDPAVADDPSVLPSAPARELFRATFAGVVLQVDPKVLGQGVVELGGGRSRLGQAVDPSVGFIVHARPGRGVAEGEVLAEVHAADGDGVRRGIETLRRAIRMGGVGEPARACRPLVSHRVLPGRTESLSGP